MTQVNIDCKVRKAFPAHKPISLNYWVGFDYITDMLVYEVVFVEEPAFSPEEELTFTVIGESGAPFEFTGVIYSAIIHENAVVHQTLKIVSKYYKALKSSAAMYGKGNAADVMKSFYAKAGVSNIITQDQSLTDFDTLCLEKDMDIWEGLTYVKSRAVGDDNGYMVSLLVGDDAYIKNIKGKNKNIGSLGFYKVQKIFDERQSVDIHGGLAIGNVSDVEVDGQSTIKTKTSATVNNFNFYSYANPLIGKQLATVAQSIKYYNHYKAVVSMPFWAALIGRECTVDSNDVLATGASAGLSSLMPGTYFIFNQLLSVNFVEAREKSTIMMKLTKDLP